MKIVDLPQGSDTWLKWRNSGIGASDIPVILGTNPYKTKLELWEEKCGFRESPKLNKAMMYGMKNEPVARKWLNENLALDLQNVCIEGNPSYLKASLDGWDFDKKILCEIKCPVTKETLEKARIHNEAHIYWKQQVQWQMMITQSEKAYLAIWDPFIEDCILIEIERDYNLQNQMKAEANKFWESIINGIAPDPGERDYIEIEDENLKHLVEEYKQVNMEETLLRDRKKVLKEGIVEFGDDGNFKAYGVKVKRCPSRSIYDIKKMADDGIDIEKYKKQSKSIGYYKIILEK